MARAIALAALVSLALFACDVQPRTEIVVVVDSDLPDLELVRVTVTPTDGAETIPTTHEFVTGLTGSPPRVPIPFSFGITPPAGDASRHIELSVVALGPGSPPREIVRRVVRTGFIRRRTLLLQVALTAACRDLSCTMPGQSCDGVACAPVDVDPGSLPNVEPGTEIGDAATSPPSDAGTPDASADAGPACRDLVPGVRTGSSTTMRASALSLVHTALGRTFPLGVASVVGSELHLQTFSGDLSTSTTAPAATIDPAVIALEATSPSIAASYEWTGAYRTPAGLTLFDATSPGSVVHTVALSSSPSSTLVRGGLVELAGSGYVLYQTSTGLSIARLDYTGASVGLGTTAPDVLAVGGVPSAVGLGGAIAVADVQADGRCRVSVLRADGALQAAGPLVTDGGCSAPLIAQLSSGVLLVAYLLPPSGGASPRLAIQTVDVSVQSVASERVVGDAASLTAPIAIAPRLDGGAMVLWGSPGAVSYVSVDGALAVGTRREVGAGTSSTDLATFRAARFDDARVAVGWIADAGLALGAICDRP